MAETLVEENPDIALYPKDRALRALARSMIAEMHSGFAALRIDCPMYLDHAWSGFQASEAVQGDIVRIEELWSLAMERSGSDGWLFGDYTLADVFYAPVAARIAGYGLKVGPKAQAYVNRHLHDPLFRQWRAEGLTEVYENRPFRLGLEEFPWPGPEIHSAKKVEHGPPKNSSCPYSGKEPTHYLEIDGRVFGFCNAGCRDKTLQDPGAFLKFMAIYES